MNEERAVDDVRTETETVAHMLDQLERCNRLAAALREEVRQGEEELRVAKVRLSETAHALADAETKHAETRKLLRLERGNKENAERLLREARLELSSASHRLITAIRRRIRKVAPPGSLRGTLLRAMTWPLRALVRKSR